MIKNWPLISVCILSFNRLDYFRKTIESFRSACTYPNLEYVIVDDPELGRKLFEYIGWAAYVAPRRVPPPGKRPVAYIVVLVKKGTSQWYQYDVGAAVMSILLAAWAEGVGCCWHGAIEREKISELLGIPQDYCVDSVISLGYPAEEPVLETAAEDTKYYLDDSDVLHVPKWPLEKVLHVNGF